MKRPAFQFYPNDWMSDSALRMCSLEARGLWIEMMCIMHDCEPYGYLSVNGKGILPAVLARRVGATVQSAKRLLAELQQHGVYSVDKDGIIFSPRMVSDEYKRNVRASGGPKSLENPNVPRRKNADGDIPKDSFHQSPSSSLSSSDSSSVSPSSETSPFLEDFHEVWSLYPKRVGTNGKKMAYVAYVRLRDQGVGAAAILSRVKQYAAYVKDMSIEETQYVKMAANFFDAEVFFAERYELPKSSRHLLKDSKVLAATQLINRVRQAASGYNPYSGSKVLQTDWKDGFLPNELTVIKAFSVGRILKEGTDGPLVSQMARALAEINRAGNNEANDGA